MRFDIRGYAEAQLAGARPVASRSGNELTAVCPACGEYGAFYVNADSGAYVCFKCEFRGRSAVGLVAQVEGVSWTQARTYIFRRSVAHRRKRGLMGLADRVRAIRPWAIKEGEDEPEQIDCDLPREFRPCYRNGKWSLPEYLKQRRIKSATARDWGLGWCRDGDYARRLVIPIDCPRGRSFTARDMTGRQWPKYMNPPGVSHSALLIGWSVVPLTGDLAIVEGPLDSIKFYQHRIPALALGGKELHDDQLAQLMTLPSDVAVTVMLDPEEEEAPLAVSARLSCYFNHIYIGKLPYGVDPGKSTRRQAYEAMDGAVRWTGGHSERLRARLRKLSRRV